MNIYRVTLKSGVERQLSREELDGRNVIGLWKWSWERKNPILIDFAEAVVMSDQIAMIDRPYAAEDVGLQAVKFEGEGPQDEQG